VERAAGVSNQFAVRHGPDNVQRSSPAPPGVRTITVSEAAL
jgi:hypothetical protein